MTGEEKRDGVNGRFVHDKDWDRLCRCGHRLGNHTAAVAGGYRDCLMHCGCVQFRPTGKRRTETAEEARYA